MPQIDIGNNDKHPTNFAILASWGVFMSGHQMAED